MKERKQERVIKMHISVLTKPHLQPHSCSHPVHTTGVLYQGCASTNVNRGMSLLVWKMATCADDFQTNKGNCWIITINSKDILSCTE